MNSYVVIFSVLILIAAIVLNSYNFSSFDNYPLNQLHTSPKKTLLTASELSQYNGLRKLDLFLAILGIVYNVTKGAEHYGVGKPYNIFIGRDATRCFITGKFDEENASDDVTGLSNAEIHSLNHWKKFYNKQYKRIGKVIGRYYDENGQATPYNKQIQKIIKSVEDEKRNRDIDNFKFPPCNVEWIADVGRTRVWCTKMSGGIQRNWVGVPRKLYEPGSVSYRCACISDEYLTLGNIEEYDGCNPTGDTCNV